MLYASVDYDGTDADDGMVASARDFTADFLTASPAAGRRPVARERVDLARLVVSELVTNAVRHAPGPCRLLLELFEDALEISVFDCLETSPVPRGHDPGRIGQHGVEIVVAVCESVSVEPHPSGKRVRARLALV
ncbi:ATP-binding protein [Streptomyces cinereoruber]|uniref:ATP-binding protein n=1 Tax=Streptomyces cinereoruber TaxID=67260 RepID=UPI003EC0427A